MAQEIYDVAIIGSGCAGLSAAIYSARYKMKTLVVTKDLSSLIAEAHKVENYPGFKSISGFELIQKMMEQAKSFKDVSIVEKAVREVTKEGDIFTIITESEKFKAHTIILAIGLQRRKLNVKGEKEYSGKGVSYCATCDGPFFKDKIVGVIGGGDAAAQATLLLAEYAKKIYLIYRREPLRCEPIYTEQIEKNDKIEIIYNTNLTEIKGEQFMQELVLDNGRIIEAQGVFIEIGFVPVSYLLRDMGVELDESKYIKINEDTETNIPGVFAAGDATDRPLKQVIVACGYGAIAAFSAYKSIKELKHKH